MFSSVDLVYTGVFEGLYFLAFDKISGGFGLVDVLAGIRVETGGREHYLQYRERRLGEDTGSLGLESSSYSHRVPYTAVRYTRYIMVQETLMCMVDEKEKREWSRGEGSLLEWVTLWWGHRGSLTPPVHDISAVIIHIL